MNEEFMLLSYLSLTSNIMDEIPTFDTSRPLLRANGCITLEKYNIAREKRGQICQQLTTLVK